MSSRELPLRLAIATCCVLIPVALGRAPYLRYAWGTNLWAYLPTAAAWASAALVLLLCVRAPRAALLHLGRARRSPGAAGSSSSP